MIKVTKRRIKKENSTPMKKLNDDIKRIEGEVPSCRVKIRISKYIIRNESELSENNKNLSPLDEIYDYSENECSSCSQSFSGDMNAMETVSEGDADYMSLHDEGFIKSFVPLRYSRLPIIRKKITQPIFTNAETQTAPNPSATSKKHNKKKKPLSTNKEESKHLPTTPQTKDTAKEEPKSNIKKVRCKPNVSEKSLEEVKATLREIYGRIDELMGAKCKGEG